MLYEYIEDNFTPERATMILRTIQLLSRFNVNEIEERLEEIAFHNDSLDTAGRIGEINNVIKLELFTVLNLHGILVVDLADDLVILHNMTAALKYVAEDYDAEYILSRINFEINDENEALDIYSAVVELLTDSSADSVSDTVYSIEVDIIHNIFKLLEEKKIGVPTLDSDSLYLDRYKRFLSGRRKGLVYELVQSNVELGTIPFANLFLLLEDQLFNLSRKELIFELISLILISDVEDDFLAEQFDKTSRLIGSTEAEGKLFLSDMKAAYAESTGIAL